MTKRNLPAWVTSTLEDIKAVDITELDVTHLTQVTDFMVVCSGTSSTHIKAIANRLVVEAKEQNHPPLGVEGQDLSQWVLVDLDDVVVHIMNPETRSLYDLEKLWAYTEEMRDQHED
jgi:ribosome-associated protein